MNDDIKTSIRSESSTSTKTLRHFIPMKVGNATVYVEAFEEAIAIEADDVRPVSVPSPQDVFDRAGEILHECVRVLGDRIETLAAKARPSEVTIEFSINFEVKGKGSIIPIFLTGETGVQTGLKVTAVWKLQQQPENKAMFTKPDSSSERNL